MKSPCATSVPTIADADRRSQVPEEWIGLNLTANDIGNIRLGMMAVLPNLASLVLAFGPALRSRTLDRSLRLAPG